MDALEALAALAETPKKLSNGRAVAGVSPLTNTDSPESGRGRGRDRKATPEPRVKSESDSGDDDGGAASAGIVVAVLQDVKAENNIEEGDGAKACYGCGREPGQPDFFDPTVFLKWAAQGKGHYCKDCHGLWRTLYATTFSLAQFGHWLKTACNKATFCLELVALCSLIFDGAQCVRVSMIAERVNVLKFVLRLLGIPSGGFVVAEIGLDGCFEPGQLDPRLLVTLLTKGGPRIGILVDPAGLDAVQMGLTIASRILRPGGQNVPTIGESRKYLHTMDGDDVAKINLIFEDEVPLPLVAVGSAPAAPAVPSALQGRLDGLKRLAKPLLEHFGRENWEAAKESQFTGFSNKLAVLMTDANAEGDQVVSESCGNWREAIVQGKLFVKLNREYLRSNRKQAKLVETGVPLRHFLTFLREELGMVPIGRLELLMYQSSFFAPFESLNGGNDSDGEIAANCASISECLENIVEKGLAALLSNPAVHGPKFSAEVWLRSLLFQGVSQNLQRLSQAPLEEAEARLFEDLGDLSGSLKSLEDKNVSLGCLAADVIAVSAIVQGGGSSTHDLAASEIRDALSTLNTATRFDVLKAAFNGTELGKTLLSGCSVLLQLGAKDQAGVINLNRALEILQEGSLPRGTVAEGGTASDADATVSNWETVADMSVAEILGESFALFDEAIGLLSPSRLEDLKPRVRKYLEALCEHLSFIDKCLCVFLRALCEHLTPLPPVADDRDNAAVLLEEVQACVQLRETLDNFGIDEKAWKLMLLSMVAYWENLTGKGAALVDTQKTVKDLKVLLANAACRDAMWKVLDCLASWASSPGEPAELLEEWRAKRAADDEQASALFRIVALLESQRKLAECPLDLGDSPSLASGVAERTIFLEDGDTRHKFHATFTEACSLPVALQHVPLSEKLRDLLRQSFQLAVDKLGETFALKAFRSVPMGDHLPMQGNLSGMLDNLVDKAQAGDQLRQVTKVFANPTKKECLWPSLTWRLLLERMMQVWPNDAFSLTLPSEPAADLERPPCTSKEYFSAWLALHDHMAQVLLCLVFLRSRYFGEEPAEPCCHNGMLKSEAVAAVEIARESLTATRTADLEGLKAFASADSAAAADLAKCRTWAETVAIVLPCICRAFIHQLVQSVVTLADEVGKVTPKYDHVVTAEKVHLTLVKRHLLGWPSKDILNAKTILLHQAFAALRQRHADWQLSPVFATDAAWKDDVSNIDVIFASAKAAIATIAAANVLFMAKGPEQAETATSFLLRNRDSLAKSLAAALDGIVATFAESAPPAKKARARASNAES